jgi:hypothetical protein
MVSGHNTNIKLGGVTYHVQTEDRGESHALIDTTVYLHGRVLHRRTNNYYDLLPLNEDSEQALKLRVDEQHRTVLEEMRDGTLQLGLPPAALTQAAAAPAMPEPAQQPMHEPMPEPAANEAQPKAEEAPVAPQTEEVPVVREPRKLLLELLNAKSWLSGKQAHLQVAVKEDDGGSVAGARVLVAIEGASEPQLYEGVTGETGTTEIRFEMPRITGQEAALLLRAEIADGSGHLRFALRAKPRVPVV